MERQYSGVDILEALESAHNYNDYLTRLIRESTESKDLIDFGAGIGTFSKRLRAAGYHVQCVEPDSLQREKLEEQGFDTCASIASVPDDMRASNGFAGDAASAYASEVSQERSTSAVRANTSSGFPCSTMPPRA